MKWLAGELKIAVFVAKSDRLDREIFKCRAEFWHVTARHVLAYDFSPSKTITFSFLPVLCSLCFPQAHYFLRQRSVYNDTYLLGRHSPIYLKETFLKIKEYTH